MSQGSAALGLGMAAAVAGPTVVAAVKACKCDACRQLACGCPPAESDDDAAQAAQEAADVAEWQAEVVDLDA